MGYTVFDSTDLHIVHGHDIPALDAMHMILTDDGRAYRIAQNENGYRLETSAGSRNSLAGLGEFTPALFCSEQNEPDALDWFAQEVIKRSGGRWSNLAAVDTNQYFRDLMEIIRDQIDHADGDERAELEAARAELESEWAQSRENGGD